MRKRSRQLRMRQGKIGRDRENARKPGGRRRAKRDEKMQGQRK